MQGPSEDAADLSEVGMSSMPVSEVIQEARAGQTASRRQEADTSASGSNRTVHDTERTLYVGNLHPYVTEAVLADVFGQLGAGCFDEVKIVRCKVTGLSAGYGFVQFTEARHAEAALATLHGRVLYGQELRLNWTFASKQQEDTSDHFQIFVGDLGNDVNHKMLLDAFAAKCPNCSDARVMWDHTSGRSKGYGFVSFRSKADAAHGIETMNGELIGSRRVRCGWAHHKQEEVQLVDEGTVDRADPNNTNIYVGNLPPGVTDGELKTLFAHFGRVVEIKLYRKGGYSFIRFSDHASAVKAIISMNGHKLRDRTLKCSWGRFPNGQRVTKLTPVGDHSGLPTPAGYFVQPNTLSHLPIMPAVMPGGTLMPGAPMLMGMPAASAMWGGSQGAYGGSQAYPMQSPRRPHQQQQYASGAGAPSSSRARGPGYYSADAYVPYSLPDDAPH